MQVNVKDGLAGILRTYYQEYMCNPSASYFLQRYSWRSCTFFSSWYYVNVASVYVPTYVRERRFEDVRGTCYSAYVCAYVCERRKYLPLSICNVDEQVFCCAYVRMYVNVVIFPPVHMQCR